MKDEGMMIDDGVIDDDVIDDEMQDEGLADGGIQDEGLTDEWTRDKAFYEALSLNELAVLAKTGDDEAIRRVYAESRAMIRSKANVYFLIGADRDDVIQEGMIGLLSAIRTFDPYTGASFKTFSELCVKRRIINAVNMAGRKKHRLLNESVSIDAKTETLSNNSDDMTTNLEETLRASSMSDPEEIVLLADLLAYVESNAPGMFSEMERTVWHYYARGSNAAQIAERLGKTPKSIDNALTRIKGKIEKLVSMY